MKFLNCLISVWNGSSQQKLFYNVFCYIIQYSLTLISPKVIHHLGGQAHNNAVELERPKPNSEKAVPKKALPSTLNQPRIDHVCDKNMREGYIKLFRTAYTLEIEPTIVSNIKINQGFPYWRRARQLAENHPSTPSIPPTKFLALKKLDWSKSILITYQPHNKKFSPAKCPIPHKISNFPLLLYAIWKTM